MESHPEPWGMLFDVDGTMVDNARYHEDAWLELGRRRGLPITPSYYHERMHSRSDELIVRDLYGDDIDPTFAQHVADEKEAIYRDLYRPHVRENPGLTQLLAQLHAANIPMAAVSNSPRPNVTMVLEALRLTPYFSVTLAQGEGIPAKPDPAMFLTAAQHLGLPPVRCLVVEDSVSGFRAAEQAGMPFIVISGGATETCLNEVGQARAAHRDFTSLTVEMLYACL